MKELFKKIQIKKAIKVVSIIFGTILIVFVSFFGIKFDFENFNWFEWLANTLILVGIMIFGLLMGTSIGTDNQKEKDNGLFQKNVKEYNNTLIIIESIKIYFSQFWLWYKARKLIEKKEDFLISNQFDGRIARTIIKNIDKEDLGELTFDPTKPHEKIFVKNGVKIKKLSEEQIELVRKTFDFTLDTYDDSYYLTLFDDGDTKVNKAEKGKKIAQKIDRDKRRAYITKIVSSLVISIIWSAMTIYEFTGEGDEATRKAWLNLLSRITALITSIASGYSTAIVNVRDQARAIEDKTDILKEFKDVNDKKIFVPETYEEMIEREYKEQLDEENKKEENKKVVEENTELV